MRCLLHLVSTTFLLFLPAFAGTAQAVPLQPFSASYTADSSQMPIGGSATRSLSQQGDGSWRLEFTASMLIASLTENSQFHLQDGQLRPLDYYIKRNALGKTRETRLSFDWTGQQISGSHRGKPVAIALSEGVLDKSTYQVALQRDVAAGKKNMNYPIVDGDEIEILNFRVLGEETVKTEVGQFSAIKVERVREEGKDGRQTRLWFARDWGFLLVRLEQVEKDGKSYQIMLKQGTVAGRTVKGR